MAIDFKHKEYSDNIEEWNTIEKVCKGRDVDEFLVTLNPKDKSQDNATRNSQYKERAVFYQIAGRTAEGLVSLMFSKKPKLEVPAALEYMNENCDGAGVSIYQQSQSASDNTVKVARCGLFTTYPKVDAELSKADMDTGKYYPTIHKYEASQIINWRFTKVGSQVKLSLTNIMELVEEVDGYESKYVDQIRELSLIENVFHQTLWRKKEGDKEWYVYEEPYAPKDGYGKQWDNIPFQFAGSLSNSGEVNDSIMYGMTKMNIGHFRNSAEWEDSIFYSGQSQPWMSGINQTHLDLMKKNEMYIGSKQLIGVPTGEQFGFATADPNPQARQGMIDKLDGMIGMGARYIQPSGPAITAEQSAGDQAMAHSPLYMISNNVSDAYTQNLKWAARYLRLPEDNILYETSKEFVTPEVKPDDIRAMVEGFVSGAIPMSSYFAWLKKVDLLDKEKTIEEFTEEVGQAGMPDMDEE